MGAHAAARVGDLRQSRDRRDPPRRGDGHLRHPRLRRQAAAAALRRPAVPRRLHQPLSARGLPREVRHRRDARHPLRQEADHAEDPDHHRRHELRLAVGAGQGGARARRLGGGHLDHDRRRRHDAGGARALLAAGLPGAALALRHGARPAAQGRRHRGGGRAGRQARRRRHAAGPEDLRARRRDAHAAGRHRPALGLPASGLDRPRRSGDQDRGAARDHRLGEADLRQGRRRAALLRHRAGGEGRRRRGGARRHAGRHGGDAGRVHRALRHPHAGGHPPGRAAPCRSSTCIARCS